MDAEGQGDTTHYNGVVRSTCAAQQFHDKLINTNCNSAKNQPAIWKHDHSTPQTTTPTLSRQVLSEQESLSHQERGAIPKLVDSSFYKGKATDIPRRNPSKQIYVYTK